MYAGSRGTWIWGGGGGGGGGRGGGGGGGGGGGEVGGRGRLQDLFPNHKKLLGSHSLYGIA